MKRASYSLYYVNSAIHKKQFCVSSRLHELLIIAAETTPGLTTYQLEGPTFSYIVNGKEKTTSIPMTATLADGRSQYWDFSNGGPDSAPSKGQQVRAAHAQQREIQRVVVYEAECFSKPVEWRNRAVASVLLYQGVTRDTLEAETAALSAILESPLTLTQLMKVLGLTRTQTFLVFLRCWLKGRLQWDIETAPLTANLWVGV